MKTVVSQLLADVSDAASLYAAIAAKFVCCAIMMTNKPKIIQYLFDGWFELESEGGELRARGGDLYKLADEQGIEYPPRHAGGTTRSWLATNEEDSCQYCGGQIVEMATMFVCAGCHRLFRKRGLTEYQSKREVKEILEELGIK